MTIKIYEEDGLKPVEIWDNYPFIPNVGDKVVTQKSGFGKVLYRVFRKDEVHIRIK